MATGSITLRFDLTGKGMGTAQLRMEVDTDEALLAETSRQTAEIEGRSLS